tara:strand:- start:1171 stop:1641 length:471 start_codon:yes stop_codon:yes gene_type:complete
MPVAEILAGIALVKSSVEFIKSNIDTCKDISELGSAIDGLLRGKDEVNKKQGKSPGVREQFDTAHIARETIDAKLAAEKLQEISTLINLRFGPGTWQGILEERARRIAEAKEAARLAKIKARKEKEELWADISMILKVMGVIVALGVGIFLLIMYA